MLQLIAYNLILTALSPLLLFWAVVRLAKGKSREGWGDRLGLLWDPVRRATAASLTHLRSRRRIWVHACSLGEVNAVRPVISQLRERYPSALIFLSTITPTGQAQARRTCREANAVFYFPFDILPTVWAALHIIRPDLCILTEKELWPNFLALCERRGTPVLVVNGTVSDTTVARARWAGGGLRWLYRLVTCFSVQTERDRERLVAVGVRADRIAVDGNTKADQPAPEAGDERALARAIGWTVGTIGLVAGSTHAGEEEVVLDAFLALRREFPAVRLILAPRHPTRAASVRALVDGRGLTCARRSELGGDRAPAGEAVVLLDTIGELRLAYRLGRAAFVGGSIISSVGGHNPLEVTAERRPVFFGPSMQSCQDVAALLLDEGLGFVVHDSQTLAAGWRRALTDDAWLTGIAARAQETVQRHQGASDRAAARAAALLQASASRDESRAAPAEHTGPLQYLLDVVEERRHGLAPELLRWTLHGLSYGYRWWMAADLALHERRVLRRKRLPVPVISIGNLTMGGTGKTLATAAVCQWLIDRGLTPAVLARGYGGTRRQGGLVFDGDRLQMTPAESGDEPFLLAASLPQARVFVGKERRETADMALSLGAQAVVLDDGFQYWKLQKDVEIVLIDALRPFGNGHVFPRGFLREPANALQRASAIWITHADLVPLSRLNELEDALAEIAPGVPVASTVHQPVALRDFTSGSRYGVWSLDGKRVLALSGIGNPASFEALLSRLGASVVPARFRDHHHFSDAELRTLTKAIPGDIAQVVTTAKDAVRFPRTFKLHCPIRVLDIRIARFSGTTPVPIDSLLDETLGEMFPPRPSHD